VHGESCTRVLHQHGAGRVVQGRHRCTTSTSSLVKEITSSILGSQLMWTGDWLSMMLATRLPRNHAAPFACSTSKRIRVEPMR